MCGVGCRSHLAGGMNVNIDGRGTLYVKAVTELFRKKEPREKKEATFREKRRNGLSPAAFSSACTVYRCRRCGEAKKMMIASQHIYNVKIEKSDGNVE